MDCFYTLIARGVSVAQEEILSAFAFMNGASGISEDLSFRQLDSQYNVETIEASEKVLNIFFETPPSAELVQTYKTDFPNVDFILQTDENKDWMSEWKKGFHTFNLTSGVRVVPSWEKAEDFGQGLSIYVDPGMAFGTGTHSTTQIAAEFLSELDVRSHSVLDVGTGTGILAILAKKKGAGVVEATEIDEDARRVARENFQLNSCPEAKMWDIQVEGLKGGYDLVIANIIDGVLIRIQEDLRRLVKPGGKIILTGILDEREAHFAENFHWGSFKKLARAQKDEWVGFLYEKLNQGDSDA